jgi:hypothetical protein
MKTPPNPVASAKAGSPSRLHFSLTAPAWLRSPLGRMKPITRLFLVSLLAVVISVQSQSTSPPSPVSKDQVLKMASSLTNRMPEQIANTVLTNRGLRCSYTTSDPSSRTYRYNFTNGWFQFQVQPKQALAPEQWYRNKDGFLTAASIHWYTNPITNPKDIHGFSLSLTNTP